MSNRPERRSYLAARPEFIAGTDGPRAFLDRCLAIIEALEPGVQAFVTLDVAAAERAADAAQARWRAGRPLSPIDGMPVGVKDVIETADMPTQMGSPLFAGYRSGRDAASVTALRRAGAIILGKTVTTEFAHQQTGKTRNPNNLAHTPGGSSSGSAAAVAAGMVPVATGTQTAGSVIRPGAYCGVAAFKPSYKLIPTIGVKCYAWSLDTVGLYGAAVSDVAFAAAAMTGRDLRVDRATPSARLCARLGRIRQCRRRPRRHARPRR